MSTTNFSPELSIPAFAPSSVTQTAVEARNQTDDSLQRLSERLQLSERRGPENPPHAQGQARAVKSSAGTARATGAKKPKKARRRFFDVTWNCNDCGRNSTPVRRHGPAGPRSLCNACGLRRSKRRRSLMNAATNDSLAMSSYAAETFVNLHAGSSLRNSTNSGPTPGFTGAGEVSCRVDVESYKPYQSFAGNQQNLSTPMSVASASLQFRPTATANLHAHTGGHGDFSIPLHPLQFVPNVNLYPSHLHLLTTHPRPHLARRPSPQRSHHEEVSRRIGLVAEPSVPMGLKPFSHGLDGLACEKYLSAAEELSDARTEGLQAGAWRENQLHQDTAFVAYGATCRDFLSKGYPRASEDQNWALCNEGNRQQMHRTDSCAFHTNHTEITSLLDLLPIPAQIPSELRADFQPSSKQRAARNPSPISSSDRVCEAPDRSSAVHPEPYTVFDPKW
jgi:ribosomal protein L37E